MAVPVCPISMLPYPGRYGLTVYVGPRSFARNHFLLGHPVISTSIGVDVGATMIKPGDILSVLEKPMGRAVFTVARVLLIGIQTGTIHTFAPRYIETVGTLLNNLATLSSMHSTVRYTRYISR